MKIISKFRDYYDAALGFGQDYSLIYRREKIEIDEKDWNFTFENWNAAKTHNSKPRFFFAYESSYRSSIEYSCFVIGFCGKLYPAIRYKYTPPGKTWENDVKGFAYNLESAIATMEQAGIEHSKRFTKGHRTSGKHMDDYDRLEKFFTQDHTSLEETFFNYKVPAFVVDFPNDYYGREGEFILNPELKEYGFQNVVPHMQAFQQIEQYLSGVIGAEGPVLYQLSDKEKITKAGFDKWSFRTMPTKKRK